MNAPKCVLPPLCMFVCRTACPMISPILPLPNAASSSAGPGKDRGGEEMFESGVGIIVTPVHVPGLGECPDLKRHCQLCPFSGTQEKGRHGTHGS